MLIAVPTVLTMRGKSKAKSKVIKEKFNNTVGTKKGGLKNFFTVISPADTKKKQKLDHEAGLQKITEEKQKQKEAEKKKEQELEQAKELLGSAYEVGEAFGADEQVEASEIYWDLNRYAMRKVGSDISWVKRSPNKDGYYCTHCDEAMKNLAVRVAVKEVGLITSSFSCLYFDHISSFCSVIWQMARC